MLGDCRPTDQLALYCFDSHWRPLLTFGESARLDAAQRLAVARTRLERLEPTWGGTNLGEALVNTVAAIEDVADTSEKVARMPRRVVLVSDLAQGTRLDALGDLEWPKDVELDIKTVADTGSNAGLQVLADALETEPAADLSRRVRVVNNAGSVAKSLSWRGSTTRELRRQSRSNFTFLREKAVSCACQCHQVVHRARRCG